MRRPLALLILAVAGLAGCSPIDVAVDYDPKADFAKIRTWAWFPEPAGASHPEQVAQQVDPLTLQRSRDAIEEILSAKGFAMARQDEADVLIAVHSAIERRVTYGPSYGWGWGWGPAYSWGPYWDGYWGPPSVYVYHEAALIVDVLEQKPAQRLIWRGVARRTIERGLTPEEREQRIREAVHELLAGFPPGPPK
jgi:hypothetical protein